MALTYTQIIGISGNPAYLQQMSTALIKYAFSRILSAAGTEQQLCVAIIKSPGAYATRFLLDALILNEAGLSTSDGTTLTTPPSDAAIDTAISTQWPAQVVVGL